MTDKEKLYQTLRQLESILRKHNRSNWAQWLAKDASCIERDDFYGVEHFLSAFGGMGSLNDIVFHPLNGDKLTEAESKRVNEEFSELKSQAYDLANTLKRSNQ